MERFIFFSPSVQSGEDFIADEQTGTGARARAMKDLQRLSKQATYIQVWI